MASCSTGLERVQFIHNALPEIDWDEIDLSVDFLGFRLRAPFLISSMTGGPDRAATINQNLAEAAERLGIAMAVGSQRISLEGCASSGLGRELRTIAPTVPLIANIGGAQLAKGWGVTQARRAIDSIGANALFVHLNPLQEALQLDGDTNWTGVLRGIEKLVRTAGAPILVKETGCGLSRDVVQRLFDVGVDGVEVAGAGGTNWGLIEDARDATAGKGTADCFAAWGVATAESIVHAREASETWYVIGSGGLANGLDAARSIRLGADLVGQAAALLRAALSNADAVVEHFETLERQLRIVCFCTASTTLRELRTAPIAWTETT